jgi:hypothetical protein
MGHVHATNRVLCALQTGREGSPDGRIACVDLLLARPRRGATQENERRRDFGHDSPFKVWVAEHKQVAAIMKLAPSRIGPFNVVSATAVNSRLELPKSPSIP